MLYLIFQFNNLITVPSTDVTTEGKILNHAYNVFRHSLKNYSIRQNRFGPTKKQEKYHLEKTHVVSTRGRHNQWLPSAKSQRLIT